MKSGTNTAARSRIGARAISTLSLEEPLFGGVDHFMVGGRCYKPECDDLLCRLVYGKPSEELFDPIEDDDEGELDERAEEEDDEDGDF